MVKIIGVSGTNGSGKDTVGLMLAERHGFYWASATDMFMEELEKRGWPIDREHKAKLSSEWRRQNGMGAIVDRAYAYYLSHQNEYTGMIVGSLRHPGEADRIHELGGKMLWVDGDPLVRYQRIKTNAKTRGRAGEDEKTFEEFLVEEERERRPIGDTATLNTTAVKERADIFIENNGNDIEVFKNDAEVTLSVFLKER